jgi:hypothetical protein
VKKKIFITILFLISFIFPGVTFSQVYDNFSGDRIDPTRWLYREFGKRIDTDTGKLLLGQINPDPSSVTLPYTSVSNVALPNPDSINSIQADVVVVEGSITNNGYIRAEISGRWYNDGTAGAGAIGDIFASVSLRDEPGGVRARWAYARCTNADCSTNDTGTTQNFTTRIDIGRPYTLYIGYDSGANQFTFRIGPEELTYDAPLTRAGLPKAPVKELRTRVQIDDATSLAAVSARFDNVYLNDAIRPLMAPVLLAPVGLAGNITELTWRAVPNAEWYQLYVSDSVGYAFTKWYNGSTQTACPTFPATCALTPPDIDLRCPCTWYVRAWASGSYGMGPWSDGERVFAEEPAAGGPAAATLVSPTGRIFTATPTFTWNAVSGAAWYLLWVNDSSSPGGKIYKWYSAATAGCPSGTGTCSVTPTTALAKGASQWWIQAWGMTGYGTPSSPMGFRVLPPVGAVLISPSGATGTTPTYTWYAVPGATWYYLRVNDASTSGKVAQWYSAAAAGCPAGTGTCTVTPAATLTSGPGTWGIMNWGPVGYGPWSSTLSFTVP